MKILILNWRDPKNPKSGGAEIVTFQHAKYWVKHGHNVIWFASKFKGSRSSETVENVKIVRGGNFLTIYLLAPIFYFFSGNNFDLVIDEIHGIPFFTPLYVRKPKIAFIHEVAGEIWDYMYPFPLSKIGKYIERKYFKLYKKVKFWTDSQSTMGDLIAMGIKRRDCIVIDCPIERKPLSKIPQKAAYPTFIFVSRLVKMKGIEDVIRAFFYIARELKDSRLWIVGSGEQGYVRELRDMVDAFGIKNKVKFWGKVDEEKKFKLLKESHILLHASVKEGWGLVVIEAASQGTPAIVYNVGGLRDSVKNGKTGVVIKENSPKEMSREALKLFHNKKRQKTFQELALKRVSDFTWEKSGKESLALISSL